MKPTWKKQIRQQHRPARRPAPRLAGLVLLAMLPAALAADGGTAGAAQAALLEEIVVSARKRPERLGDLPRSAAVLDRSLLAAGDSERIADLQALVPGLASTETGVGTRLSLRGIGSGNNPGFEQSVGQYVDGIFHGRQRLIRMPFLDPARVEILRGPQSVLLGKNAIAGALHRISARPTRHPEARIAALYEARTARRRYDLTLSGPLTRPLRARLAWRGLREAGHLDNTRLRRREPGRDEDALRLSLAWDARPDLEATLKLERNRFASTGRPAEIVLDQAGAPPPGHSPLAGLNLREILTALGHPAPDNRPDRRRQTDTPEAGDTTVDNITLRLDRELAAARLTLISGLLRYDFVDSCDCDHTPAPLFNIHLAERYTQASQEVRLSSAHGARLAWTAGAYFQANRLRVSEGLAIPGDSLLSDLAAQSPSLAVLAALPGSRAVRRNRQQGRLAALFAQLTWPLGEAWRLTLGGRYALESQRARRDLQVTGAADDPASTALAYYHAFGMESEQLAGMAGPDGTVLEGHALRGRRREGHFTPLATLQWNPTPATLLYASGGTGYKAGGFDARANTPRSFEFDDERAGTLELGLRHRSPGGALELGAALFHTDYRDLQVSQFDGALGFNVTNAAATRVRGLEVDGRFALSPTLQGRYAWAWLDFAFTDFRQGNCYQGRASDGATMNGVGLCDYGGQRGQFAAEHGASLALDYLRPLPGTGLDLSLTLSLNYTGARHVHDNLDPRFRVGPSTRLDLGVGLEGGRWRLRLLARNLTDDDTLSYAGDVPGAARLFGTHTFFGFLPRPRELALQAVYHWR